MWDIDKVQITHRRTHRRPRKNLDPRRAPQNDSSFPWNNCLDFPVYICIPQFKCHLGRLGDQEVTPRDEISESDVYDADVAHASTIGATKSRYVDVD